MTLTTVFTMPTPLASSQLCLHCRRGREYEEGHRARGDVTIWFSEEAIDNWVSRPSGSRGGQQLYSDLAIETSLTLRTLFGLPLRQTEGFVGSLLRMLGLDQLQLPVPDHSTLSRRAQSLEVTTQTNQTGGPFHSIVDSTGLQIVGEGPWAAAVLRVSTFCTNWALVHESLRRKSVRIRALRSTREELSACSL